MEIYSHDEQSGVKNQSLLESAIEHTKSSEFEGDSRKIVCGKAAVLFESIAQNDVFSHANECTALASLAFFLRYNGYRLKMETEEKMSFTLDVANHRYPLKETGQVISTHSEKI